MTLPHPPVGNSALPKPRSLSSAAPRRPPPPVIWATVARPENQGAGDANTGCYIRWILSDGEGSGRQQAVAGGAATVVNIKWIRPTVRYLASSRDPTRPLAPPLREGCVGEGFIPARNCHMAHEASSPGAISSFGCRRCNVVRPPWRLSPIYPAATCSPTCHLPNPGPSPPSPCILISRCLPFPTHF